MCVCARAVCVSGFVVCARVSVGFAQLGFVCVFSSCPVRRCGEKDPKCAGIKQEIRKKRDAKCAGMNGEKKKGVVKMCGILFVSLIG